MFSYKYKTCRKLSSGLVSSAGRNYTGCLTLLHRSGPKMKWSYTYIDYFRSKISSHIVIRFDFSSFHNRYLTLAYDFKYGLSYYNSVEGVRILQTIYDNNQNRFGFGSSIFLYTMASGQLVSNVYSSKFSYSKFGRSPGAKILILSAGSSTGQTLCKLPSGDTKIFPKTVRALSGSMICNAELDFRTNLSKASFKILRGRRPVVRGVAKNPVDHPHGGGEGKKSPPSAKKSPWGWIILILYIYIYRIKIIIKNIISKKTRC